MWLYQLELSRSRPGTSECEAAAGSAVGTATNKLPDHRHTSLCLSCREADRRCNKPHGDPHQTYMPRATLNTLFLSDAIKD